MLLLVYTLFFSLIFESFCYIEQCDAHIGHCGQVLPFEYTKELSCFDDSNCPKDFKCCQDCSFQHKICKKSIKTNVEITEKELFTEIYCPTSKPCKNEPKYSKNLICSSDNSCPHGYFCCLDSCYGHRVCKKGLHNTKKVLFDESYCPVENITCKNTIPIEESINFLCSDNNKCPNGYSCCRDSCYQHRVCKKSIDVKKLGENCPKDLKLCKTPHPLQETEKYECNEHKICPDSHSCCSDSCFQHNVCKKSVENVSLQCPVDEDSCNKKLDYNQTKMYECDDITKICTGGFLCCNDSCYQHKICKDPVGLSKHNPKCPKLNDKCKRQIVENEQQQFKCSDDSHCSKDEICCPNECLSYKVCTPFDTETDIENKNENMEFEEKVLLTTEKTQNTNNNCPKDLNDCENIREGLVGKTICESNKNCNNLETCCPYQCIPGLKICRKQPIRKCPKLTECDQSSFTLIGKTICYDDNQCSNDDICCEDNCILHYKLCKKPIVEDVDNDR